MSSKTLLDLAGKAAIITGALFLASPMADSLNGTTIDIIGGSWLR